MAQKKKKSVFPVVMAFLTVIAILLGSIDYVVYSKYYKGGKYKKLMNPTKQVDITDPNNNSDCGRLYYSPIDEAHVVESGEAVTYIDNEVLVVANEGVSREQIASVADRYNAEIVGEIEVSGDYQLKLSTTPEELDSTIGNTAQRLC